MFPEAENTFRSDFCSLSGCHSVCLEPQNSQSEAARLTCWAARLSCLGCKIDYIEGFFAGFCQPTGKAEKRNFAYLLNVNNIHESRETTNNRRKTAARKARRFLQRFLYAKIVSYPCSTGQWLTLFLTLALFQAEGAGSQGGRRFRSILCGQTMKKAAGIRGVCPLCLRLVLSCVMRMIISRALSRDILRGWCA